MQRNPLFSPPVKSAPQAASVLVHVGCSGWLYWYWRQLFYPAGLATKDWFQHYTAAFDTVELNAPFYRWPKQQSKPGAAPPPRALVIP